MLLLRLAPQLVGVSSMWILLQLCMPIGCLSMHQYFLLIRTLIRFFVVVLVEDGALSLVQVRRSQYH